jgi:hypothetical protein
MGKIELDPAFPSHGSMGEVAHQGMSLRDWFAGQAMRAIISAGVSDNPAGRAKDAYRHADAMLAEREKNHGQD